MKSVFNVIITRYNKCNYAAWHGVKQILNVFLRKGIAYDLNSAVKVCLLKLQGADQDRDAKIANSTRVQWARYSANKQAKEEAPYVGLNRNLEQFLKHPVVHYTAERHLQRCLEERENIELNYFTDVHVVIEIILNSKQIGSSMRRNHNPDHNFGYSATMSFNNALWKAKMIAIASDPNAAIMVPQTEA